MAYYRGLLIALAFISAAIFIQTSQAILVGNSTSEDAAKSEVNQNIANSAKELDTNSSFYYESDSYLLNPDEQGKSKKNVDAKVTETKESKHHNDGSAVKPASFSMTSARNGRMLDLDALVGDFAASKANKERNLSGNRQSRFLSSGSLEAIGAKKQLQIQGFIPIIGVKDVVDDETASTSNNQQQPQTIPPNRYQQQPHDLPYAQSSIGHASFGVQRYLNTEQSYPSNGVDLSSQASHHYPHPGSSVVDALKRPIRKLSGFPSISQESNHLQAGGSSQSARQNCLCVPFYICKNGYISESSLGKTQIQQMIAQQQQQQLASLDQAAEVRQSLALRSGSVESVPIQQVTQYPLIDERSLDREIVTAPSTTSFDSNASNQAPNNHTIDFAADASLANDLNQLASLADSESGKLNSSSLANGFNSSDYSQEILGRMLGLGSSSKSGQHQSSSSSSSGSCGLLRTCCNIPMHLFPSQQDLANEKLMSQYGSAANAPVNRYQSVQATRLNSMPQINDIISLPSQQQQQQYPLQIGQSAHFTKLPYGLPSQGIRSHTSQPLDTFNSPSDGLLAHRSTLQSAQPARSYPQAQQHNVAQYTRAISPMQSLQSFIQPNQQQQQSSQQQMYQQQLAKALAPMSSSSRQYLNQIPPQQQSNPSAALLSQANLQSSHPSIQPASTTSGTRKILEGRCGLRNSAGITGRVQNLQYHESSADFGEYPAQAAILKRLSGSDNLFVCGATLISQYWVATAAHCIKKHSQSDLKVRLGEWDVHRDDEFYPYVEKEIRDLIIHPEFVAGNLINDIALLRLDSPVDPSLPHVNPACLPTINETFDRQHCSVTGWGKDSFGQKGSFQAVLREVELPVVGHQECESALRSTRLGPHYRLHSGFICAGGEGGKDACEGDGGSGLYCHHNGVIKVVGLVSWGIGCGQAGVPGVYVNLAHYRPWIENIISIDEDIYSPYNNLIGNTLISERSNAGNSTNDLSNTTTSTSNSQDLPLSTTNPPPTISSDM